jgi:hypothetical protein
MAKRAWSRWTDTDDAVVIAFYPAEAAAILGRTLAAVMHRRRHLACCTRAMKPRKRLRRDYFKRDSQGPREEIVPQPAQEKRKCRFCPHRAFARGLCRGCLDRAYWLIQMGYVPLWVAERRWFAVNKYGRELGE